MAIRPGLLGVCSKIKTELGLSCDLLYSLNLYGSGKLVGGAWDGPHHTHKNSKIGFYIDDTTKIYIKEEWQGKSSPQLATSHICSMALL